MCSFFLIIPVWSPAWDIKTGDSRRWFSKVSNPDLVITFDLFFWDVMKSPSGDPGGEGAGSLENS